MEKPLQNLEQLLRSPGSSHRIKEAPFRVDGQTHKIEKLFHAPNSFPVIGIGKAESFEQLRRIVKDIG